MTGLKLGELDILDGSPPCSAFSIAGRREKGWGTEKKYSEDKKVKNLEDLFFYFIRKPVISIQNLFNFFFRSSINTLVSNKTTFD